MRYTLLLAMSSLWLTAQNPLVKDVGMSDPHARVFNDTLYLFTGHDDSPSDPLWVMKDWRVFSTTDLVNWTHVETISPADNYMGAGSIDCWASDAAERSGQYYFYFSDQKRSVGVMTAPHPTGPFEDPLGKPLVAPRHDPTAFIDDDAQQTPYLVYGDKEESYHVVRLNEDMISLAEAPQQLTITGEEWAKAPKWMDKNYLFKYNGTYYLSWGRDYATAENIYGPYTGRGAVGTGHHLDQFAHGSFFWWKGQFYHVWCYYVVPGKKFRETIITYAHIADDGQLVTDTGFLDDHYANGVGRYNASWSRIEAEWYYEMLPGSSFTKRSLPGGGFQVAAGRPGDWLCFANVDFSGTSDRLSACISNVGTGGRIEVRLDSTTGKKIAELSLPDTGSTDTFLSVEAAVSKTEGVHDLYFVIAGNPSGSVSLDWVSFQAK